MSVNKSENKLFLPVLSLCSFLVGFDLIVTIPLIPTIVKDTNMSLDLGLVTSSAMYAGPGLFTAIAAASLLSGDSFIWVGILCNAATSSSF
ncbi:hypothetical protein SAMN04488072_102285 [Lentibacillus halodurans]|uniref:Uncharacterized protein n=1 Tax=Lentibacillus halodurans TaxID=237679 RepID=A0A1I0W8I6_9BACI|nr:hypothetical protein [Lentibacillus halodurans]SFA84637.1 hypothetical protein SAMN04488072_102285 [Lentibacillus halodurans]